LGQLPSDRAAEGAFGARWRGLPAARLGTQVALAALGAAYFAAGKLGLKLAFVHASASAVWPPTGIAIAAFLVLGPRVWPAILAGAFLVNVTTAGSVLTSLGIAVGNTLEGLVGSWLVGRYAAGTHAFERPADVFRFALLAGLVGAAVSATCGVTSLRLGGYAGPSDYGAIWRTWWLGDVGGALVVAPALVLWATRPWPRWPRGRAREASLLMGLLLAVGVAVFGGWLPWAQSLSFLALPCLLWAALRFEPRATATANVLLAGVAVWGALRDAGPFSGHSPNEALVLLQAFMGIMSVTSLVVAAAVRERRSVEEALSRAGSIVDSSDDAVVSATPEGTIVSWNAGAERLYGYGSAQAQGRPLSILEPDDQAGRVTYLLASVRSGRVVEYESRHRRHDGSGVDVSVKLSPIRGAGGALAGASFIARDITRQKRAGDRLATQFAVTRTLAEAASLREAAPHVLHAVCDGVGWHAGELWRAPGAQRPLQVEAGWPPAEGAPLPPLGLELANRVRESGQDLWVEDLARDGTLAGSPPVAAGFRAGYVSPVRLGTEVVAVLAFWGRRPRAPRQELLELMDDVGTRLAQFLERERVMEGLRRLQKAVETIELGVTITDVDGRILYTNPAEAAMHGYQPAELIGQHVGVFMPAGWGPAPGRPSGIQSWRRETVNARRDGSVFPVQLLSDAVRDPDGTPVAVVTCTEEITERKRAEDALRSSESRYRLLFERNLAGVYRATLGGRLLECNEAFAQMLGYSSREEMQSLSVSDFAFGPQEPEQALEDLRQKGALTNVERLLRRRDGGLVWALENQTLLFDGGEALVEATLIDITERKEFERQIQFHAYHDPLTALPNRTLLIQRLPLLLAQARASNRGLAVMFLDLDEFKRVNDTLGHPAGDRLLQQVAVRLRECVREDDMIARVGGDEFVLVLPHVRRDGAVRIARKILARMQEPLRLDGQDLCPTTSLGIALAPQDGDDAETLLKKADAAMYRAKQGGKNGFRLSDAGRPRPARSASTRSGES
jgi:diguanylate cyclase (GGDEF)-like protein/PAS domain S-box-containing protein